jgi:hypothetical protein
MAIIRSFMDRFAKFEMISYRACRPAHSAASRLAATKGEKVMAVESFENSRKTPFL